MAKKLRMVDCKCAACGWYGEDLVNLEDPKPLPCEICGAAVEVVQTMGAPTVLQASYPDGHKRPGFTEGREAAKLKVAMANLPLEKRGEIKKEIQKLGGEPKDK
jgi:hypothetical protein